MFSKQAISKKLGISAERAWMAISRLDRLDVWFPIIANCRVDGQGVGAWRYMTTVDGGEIHDVIEICDDQARRLVYRRPVSPFPVSEYRGSVEVFTSYDGLAVVVWTIDFQSELEVADEVAGIVQQAISAGIDGMESDLRG